MLVNLIWKPEFEIRLDKTLLNALMTCASVHYSHDCHSLIDMADGKGKKNGLLEIIAQRFLFSGEEEQKYTITWRDADLLLKACEAEAHCRVTDSFKHAIGVFQGDLRHAMDVSRLGPRNFERLG